MSTYYYKGAQILAPLNISSNEPMFDMTTVSLKTQRASQGYQRWELSFDVVADPSNQADLFLSSFKDLETAGTMVMPQLTSVTDVDNYIAPTSGATNLLSLGIASAAVAGATQVVVSNAPAAPAALAIGVTNSGGSAYVFSGSVTGSNATVSMTVGQTVNFSVSASGHPFYINTVNTTGTGNQVSTPAATGQGTQSGVVSWTPNTAGTYYYNCSIHGGMNGQIIVAASSSSAVSVGVLPRGSFVKFSNHDKIYIVTEDTTFLNNTSNYVVKVYPKLKTAVATSHTFVGKDSANLTFYRDINNSTGITFSDGVMSSIGSVSLIEAV